MKNNFFKYWNIIFKGESDLPSLSVKVTVYIPKISKGVGKISNVAKLRTCVLNGVMTGKDAKNILTSFRFTTLTLVERSFLYYKDLVSSLKTGCF